MAINIRDIQSRSPQVSVEGSIELDRPEIEDSTNAMIVGPSERGPSLVPTEIRSSEEFQEVFGDPTTYSSFSASEVLKQTDRVNFVRTLSSDGWEPSPMVISTSFGTDFPNFADVQGGNVLAILILDDDYKRKENVDPSKTRIVKSTSTSPGRVAEDFTLEVFDESDNLVDDWRLSFNRFSGRYITRVLPPEVRIYQNFQESQNRILDTFDENTFIKIDVFDEDSEATPLKFDSYSAPRTPWILSQDKAPDASSELRHRLFRLWVRSDGEDQNRRFKASIVDIGGGTSESGWPTFTLRLRDFDDTDLNQEIIEEFPDLSLNPDDSRYIAKVIGTEYRKYNEDTGRVESFGIFDRNSYKIRVETSSEISRSDKNTLPFGFETYKQTFTESLQVPVYRTDQDFPGRLLDYKNINNPESDRGKDISRNLHLGVEFRIDENLNFFQGIPEGAEKIGDPFKLDDYVDPTDSNSNERKFTLGFQGGSDGQSIYKDRFVGEDIEPENTFGLDFDGKFSGGQVAYRKAFELLRDTQGGYDFNLLATPELDFQNHERTVREAEELVRGRGDAFYVFDGFEISDSPEEAASYNLNIDSTYVATYYGWVRPTTDIDFDFVPPSAMIPQTYARSDSIADPWFSPAGPNRGVVPNAEELQIRLPREDVDKLYEKSINAIRLTDPGGILLAGNRCYTDNLETLFSAIDVRRTLVYVISRVKNIAQDYLFEQTNQITAQNFRTDINEALSTIETREGIRQYEIDISTPRDRGVNDRSPNTITASVSLVPQPSSEYITVQFTINEESVNVIT